MHPRTLAERRTINERRKAADDALAAWSVGGAIDRRQGARRTLERARVNAWLQQFHTARQALETE